MKPRFILAIAALFILSLAGCSQQPVTAIVDSPIIFRKVEVDGETVTLTEIKYTVGDTSFTCRQYIDSIKLDWDHPAAKPTFKLGKTCFRRG